MIEHLETTNPCQRLARSVVVDAKGRRLLVSTIDPADMPGCQTLVFEAHPDTDEPASYLDLFATRHGPGGDGEAALRGHRGVWPRPGLVLSEITPRDYGT